jgi:hypothetical protein
LPEKFISEYDRLKFKNPSFVESLSNIVSDSNFLSFALGCCGATQGLKYLKQLDLAINEIGKTVLWFTEYVVKFGWRSVMVGHVILCKLIR